MSTLSRRSVARGAAWSVPSITVAAASPAVAASPPPGLQGRVWWTEDCRNQVVTIKPDDTSNRSHLYPNGEYGFYVFNTKADQLSGACMTFTYPVSLGQLKWAAASDNGEWSLPKYLSTDGKANTYQSCYTGSFVDRTYSDPKNNSSYYAGVTSYPSFTAPISSCPNPLTIEVTRTVVVKNKGTLTFSRTVQINAQNLVPGASGVGG